MCGGPEHSKPAMASDNKVTDFHEERGRVSMSEKVHFSVLLELAANNDLIGFKQAVEEDGSAIDEVSLWYGRKNGSKRMGLEQRTPVMIAALYGSIDVLNYILSAYVTCGIDVNLECGSDKSTALHCAAAGGSSSAVETVRLLLQSAADVNRVDASGRRAADVIMVSPKLPETRATLNMMLNAECPMGVISAMKAPSKVSDFGLCFSVGGSEIDLAPQGGSNGMGSLHFLSSSPEGSSPKVFSAASPKILDSFRYLVDGNEKKEYPVDPSLPDIKNSIYSTDEFRMYSFKVRPCSRAYSHDWTECPFVHPGENARRRDPRRYHYSCVPCPEFRKGACRRGDLCEYAHGVFECWLHPAQYRTRLCKDETSCTRRVCFFAHTPEELRPLYVSTGSAVPSPRTSSSLDIASAVSPLALGSPSSMLMMSTFSSSNLSQGGLSTPPLSPSSSSANSLSHSTLGGTWPQPNVPSLHLAGGSLQASRLRAALNARDMPVEDLTGGSDYEAQLLNELSSLSAQPKINAVASGAGSASFRSGKYKSHGISTVAPTNLEDLFASEMMSPRALEPSILSLIGSQMQSHKAAHGHSQLQNQMQSPIGNQISQMHRQMQQGAKTPGHLSLPVQSSYSVSSLGRTSSLGADLERQNSNGSSLSPAMLAAANSRAAAFAQRDKRSYSSRDLGAQAPTANLSDWGSPTGKVDWGVQGEELNKFRKSASFGYRSSEEPDLSWVQTLVKEAPGDSVDGVGSGFSIPTLKNRQIENIDHPVRGSWVGQVHLDQQMVA